MIDTPQIVQTTAMQTAMIHFAIPPSTMPGIMEPAIGELMAVMAAQGVKQTGPMLCHHLKMPGAVFDFELSFPVDKPVTASGRVQPGLIPAMRAAKTTYYGPYEGLGNAWGEFGKWIAANGHTPANSLVECYAAGPESSPDPAYWRTEFTRPLLD